jgi:hypothetical protein
VKRPTIDTSAHYKRVRPRDVQPDDAITFDPPAPGVRYYRITEVKPGKIGGTKVYGYFVGTKKAEDSGRVSEQIKFVGGRGYLIERSGEKPEAKPTRTHFKSDHAGHGFSDGVEYKSANIPNNIGSIVEMPRSEVRDDPHQDCSVGLHVATLNFAKGYMGGGKLLKLVVNPRDVVSVPHRDAAKVRVCRYRVLEEVSTTA